MALSKEQKERNKAATLIRNRAHSRRVKMLREALAQVDHSPELQEARRKEELICKAFDLAVEARNLRVNQLMDQVAKIQTEIKDLQSNGIDAELIEARRNASQNVYLIDRRLEAEIEAMFPDLDGRARWSAAAWSPPQEVLDEMEAARNKFKP